MSKLSSKIDITQDNYGQQAKMLAEISKMKVQTLVKSGYIVLDSSTVLNAPKGYYFDSMGAANE